MSPRSSREYCLRWADEALNDLQRALANVAQVKKVYDGELVPAGDPDKYKDPETGEIKPPTASKHSQAMQMVGDAIVAVYDTLKVIREQVM